QLGCTSIFKLLGVFIFKYKNNIYQVQHHSSNNKKQLVIYRGALVECYKTHINIVKSNFIVTQA
ncbi:hypothetical protein P4244_28700, partial [Bacillus thuringiensis]|nr:hypothetical protein [Bacillus thuringiensis]